MLTLFYHPLCPFSRYVRLILGEYGIEVRLVEERFWERREEFLLLNPAGQIPVLVADGQPAIPGASIIAEYIEETHTAERENRLLPATPGERVEVRRLASWFNDKFHSEVSGPLVSQRGFTEGAWRGGGGRRPPGPGAEAPRPPQYPLSSGLYRLAGAHTRLARRRPAELGRSCRGGGSVRRRLTWRCC